MPKGSFFSIISLASLCRCRVVRRRSSSLLFVNACPDPNATGPAPIPSAGFRPHQLPSGQQIPIGLGGRAPPPHLQQLYGQQQQQPNFRPPAPPLQQQQQYPQQQQQQPLSAPRGPMSAYVAQGGRGGPAAGGGGAGEFVVNPHVWQQGGPQGVTSIRGGTMIMTPTSGELSLHVFFGSSSLLVRAASTRSDTS